MNLETATERVKNILTGKQDPDKVTYTKQWDEFGVLKGWMIGCEWVGQFNDRTCVDFDMTRHYTRVLGNLDEIPDYIPGKHQRV